MSYFFNSRNRGKVFYLAHVTRLDDRIITLEEEQIPLSRRKKEEFIKKFQKYDLYYRG